MSVQIRPAKPEDAGAIARIAAITGVASIDAESPRVSQILGESRTLVAAIYGDVIGFADGFFTPDPTGGRRYELDLLAVAPAARGRGVGKSLAAASLAAARDGGARHIRALVRCDNTAMQQLCRRCGFSRSSKCFALQVIDPRPVAPRSRYHDARLIAVETLSYAGLWLEGELSQEAIDDAHWLASQRGLTVIGAAMPCEALAAGNLLRANGFQKMGEYHWWTVNLKSDQS